ncbi:YceI family protein [Paramagnetospirillum magnetotacticum MS-1]|uniref:YceI family protein n=1 Tax=Paramagnetospirillum magnetotacticum MS-1 TaxID=272627 RepID=A0A0C2YZC1_PARME|nr:YceI family protein [Paramagnetospirillum magnetotacticum]KIM00001.1 YceI family protein [Paramagnetospirillum magnetotacticum MS-1]
MKRYACVCLMAAALWSNCAAAAEWNVDTGKSRLGFIGSQGGSPFEGKFTRWSAKIDFDPANPASAKVAVEIDMSSAQTGDAQKDQSLPGADWFDAKTFPKARFEASGFKPKGANAFEAPGTLTIRGMGKSVTLPFSLDIKGGLAHAKGRLDLIRTDFGVGQGEWKSGDMVALQVAVVFELEAAAKP